MGYKNGNIITVADASDDYVYSDASLSPNKKYIVYIKTKSVDTEGQKLEPYDVVYDTDLMLYDIANQHTKTIVDGCDGISGGTPVPYANTRQYNFPCIYQIQSFSFS